MATRWKHERTYQLFLMHAHNMWSNWFSALEEAACQLGLTVASRSFLNPSYDGSVDTSYYVCAPQLERIGGIQAVERRAQELHEQMMGYVE